MIHHWLGWISLAICVLLLAKLIGRLLKSQKLNKILRKIHKPLGLAVIAISAVHGIISFIKNTPALLQNITGIILFILIVILAVSFYDKKRLKKQWFKIHRYSAAVFTAAMIIHIAVSFS